MTCEQGEQAGKLGRWNGKPWIPYEMPLGSMAFPSVRARPLAEVPVPSDDDLRMDQGSS